MATATPTPYDPETDEDGRAAARAFLWVLIAFKLATVALIFYHLRTAETGLILTATTWFWLPIIAMLVAGPLLFRYRLRRVRAKREQLRRAEWMVGEGQQLPERTASRR